MMYDEDTEFSAFRRQGGVDREMAAAAMRALAAARAGQYQADAIKYAGDQQARSAITGSIIGAVGNLAGGVIKGLAAKAADQPNKGGNQQTWSSGAWQSDAPDYGVYGGEVKSFMNSNPYKFPKIGG